MYNLVGLDKCIHSHDPHPCCWMSKGTKSAHQTEKSFFFWLHWVFVAACGLSSCGERALLLLQCTCVSLQRLPYCWLSSASGRAGFSSCGTWVAHVMWNHPRPGIAPMSPALAGGFLSTVPWGMSLRSILRWIIKVDNSIHITSGSVYYRVSYRVGSGSQQSWSIHSCTLHLQEAIAAVL